MNKLFNRNWLLFVFIKSQLFHFLISWNYFPIHTIPQSCFVEGNLYHKYKIQWVVLVLSFKFSAFDTVDWSLKATMECFHSFGSQDVTLFSFIFYFSNFFIFVVLSFPQTFFKCEHLLKAQFLTIESLF